MSKTTTLPTKYEPGFLDRMDGRTEVAKRLQAAFDAIVDDIGGGDNQTHLRLALVERAVFLEFQLRRWEQGILTGKIKDEAIGRWIQATNALLGLARTLGLDRSKIGGLLDSLYDPDPEPQESPVQTPDGASAGSTGEGPIFDPSTPTTP